MAIAFVDAVAVTGSGASAAKNMSACNGAGGLFVAIIGGLSAVSGPSADTGSNVWTGATARAGSAGGNMQAFYVVSPSASATHTFTNGSSAFSTMHVLGFSGCGAFDKESGAASQSTPESPGSLTPTTDGTSLFVCGIGGGTTDSLTSLSSPFTLESFTGLSGGVTYSCGAGYYIQVSSGAQNPAWVTNATDGVVLLVFAPAGGGATTWGPLLGMQTNRLVVTQ